MQKAELEKKISEASGKYSEEIIAKVKELAAVDVKIKAACDEIESIEQSLCDKHNELASRINELVHMVCDEPDAEAEDRPEATADDRPEATADDRPEATADDRALEGDRKKPEPKRVKIEVHVVKARPVNPALMALMDFLLS